MNPYPNHTFRWTFPPPSLLLGGLLLVFSLLIPRSGFAVVDAYKVTSSYGAGPYNVNQSVTFHIAAMSGGITIPTYTGSVSIGLYDSKPGPHPLSDSLALFDTIPPSGPQTGIGVFTFAPGGLNISMVYKTGSPAEQLLIQEIGGSGISLIYPGPGTVFQTSTAFNVTGFLSKYFLMDADGDNAPASWSAPGPATDLLTSNLALVNMSPNKAATVAFYNSTSIGPVTANAYAVTGVNGGYSGSGSVSISLNLGMTNNTLTRIFYEVILDYDGNLTDYSSPVSLDSVFFGSVTISTASYNVASIIGSGGSGHIPPSTSTFMNNGQVVLLLWTNSSSTGTDPVSVRYQSVTVGNLSSVTIPFSPANIQPVKAIMNPTVFAASTAAAVTMTIQNLSGSPISVLSYKVPANPSGLGDWDLPTFPATLTGHSGSTIIYQAPSGTTDGSFTVSMFGSDAITVNENITIGMQGTATSVGGGALWGFNLMGVTSTTNLSLPTDSSGATVTTYGVPSASSGITASPANFNSVGNQVSLAWGPVTDEGASGYVVYRAFPPGVGFSAVQTLSGSGTTSWTDSGVTNLSNYNYTVQATNGVATGGPVTSNSVIPFANASPPTPVAALTGGTTVQVNWTAATAGSYALAGYQVWRDTSPSMSGASAIATIGVVTSYNDTTVSAGAASFYYYGLAAFDNQYASGAPGSAHIANLTAPVTGNPSGFPPTGLTVALIPTPANLHLSWTPPINVLNALTNYYIWRGVNGATPSAFTTIGSGSSTYDDAAVTAGSNYAYQVFGVQGAGVTSNPSNPVTGYVGPGAPTALTKYSYQNSITLVWSAPVSSQGETVVSYVIQRTAGAVTASFGPVTSAASAVTYGDNSPPADGTDYAYVVAAIDQNGVTGAFTAPVSAAISPQIPTGLTGTYNQASNSITLAWATPTPPEPNLAEFWVYREKNSIHIPSDPLVLPSTPTTFFSFLPADAGATFAYQIYSQSQWGGGSQGYSNKVQIIIPPNTPATPSAVASGSAITLTWTPNPVSEAVTGYAIYRDGGSGFSLLGNTASAAITDSAGLLPGVNYVYKIKAINRGGSSFNYSGPVTWGLGPTTPGGVTITSIDTGNNIGVSWTNVTVANANATAVSLYVTTSNISPFGGVTVQFTPPSTSAVTDTGFLSGGSGESAGTTFFYWLQTVNPYGNSSPASGGPVSKLTYPGAPNLAPVVLAPDGFSRILNWTAPVPSGSVTQYLIYREISGSGTWINTSSFPASVAGTAVTLSTAIQPGQTYDYKVVAVNPTGNGPDSNIRTFSTLPSAPVSVTAVSGVSPSTDQVNLTWADPLAGAENVTNYSVYRSPSNATTATYTALVTVGSGTFNYSDTTVSDLTAYYYLITATSNVPLESFLSTTNAIAVTAFLAPNPPTSPVATAANGSVSVAWTPAAATSYPVSVYVLNRTANGVSVAPVTVASPATGFNNTSLTNGVTYVYTIQTEDNQGNLSASTGPVTGLPLAVPGPPLNPNAVTGDTKLLLTWNPATPGTLPIGGYQIYTVTAGPVTTLIYTAPSTLNSYLVSGLSNGAPYTFVMNTLDNSGVTTGLHVSSYTAAFAGSPVASQVNPPSNLAALAGNAQVLLSWTDSVTIAAPVTGYAVYQSSSGLGGTFTQVGLVAATGAVNQSVTQTGLTNGTNYAYYLVAMANTGTVASNSATVTGIPASPPAAPASLIGVDGNNKVTLTWPASPAQGSITILGYYVIQNITSGSPVTFFTSGPVTTYTDSTVSNGQSVTYVVGAINSNGTAGLPTSPILGYPYAAFAPTITGHASSTSAVTLTFTPPGTVTWGPLASYNFVRTVVSTGVTSVFSAGSVSPAVDSTAVVGTLYSYQLEAIDAVGHISAASNAVTDGAANAPAAPATLMVVPGSQEVLIDWPAPVSVAGSLPVSYYLLTINGGAPINLPVTQSWYLDSGLTDPAAVTVSVTVVDDSGQITSNHSVTLNASSPVTTATTKINPPTNLTATALSTSSIQLIWNAPNDMGYPVTAFKVYRSSSFISTPAGPVTQIASPPSAFGPVTTFTDTGLSASTTYFYVVQAVYAQTPSGLGPTNSPDSNNASVKTVTPIVPPPPVQGNMVFDVNVLLPNTGQLLNITFQAPNSGPAELDVYNVSGNPVRALYATAVGGSQVSLTWDGKDRNGKTVASGLYLIEIKGPGIHLVRKVIVVK